MDYLDNCKNKVYINPNFNKLSTNNFPSTATMHVNPKFTNLVSNVQCNTQNKNKIYVNPNFIKAQSVRYGNQCMPPVSTNNDVIADNKNATYTSNIGYTCQRLSTENKLLPHQVPIAQSRYCLVRQNVINKQATAPVLEKTKTTFKLNKYKSVTWSEMKRNLDNVKHITNNNSTAPIESNFQSVCNESKNKFRVINTFKVNIMSQDKIRIKMLKSNQASQLKVRKAKGNLKKNNIPCPLFRKYGKCLRMNTHNKCEFLHDKKHVSVCRKFIKGLCHDKECLLSHDLTSKKMPTCYFYLEGTCTKSDCPYLHVKLNEKAKICPDFLKGYCEKGSKCLQRHINVSIEMKNKQTSYSTKTSVKNKSSLKLRELRSNNSYDRQNGENFMKSELRTEETSELLLTKSNNSEYRYYQEHQDSGSTNETSEIIKPMRCKLGTLPSFIQL